MMRMMLGTAYTKSDARQREIPGKLVHRCGNAVDAREVKSSIKSIKSQSCSDLEYLLKDSQLVLISCGRTRTLGEAFDPRRALVMARPAGPG